MFLVCQKHGKKGLETLNTPHVEKFTDCKGTCQFCNRKADIKIIDSMPIQIISKPKPNK